MAHEEGSELDRELVEGVPREQALEIDVKDALAWSDGIDSSKIRVAVCGTAVTLSGEVPTEKQRALAEEVVGRIHGVTDVANDLQVVGAPQRR